VLQPAREGTMRGLYDLPRPVRLSAEDHLIPSQLFKSKTCEMKTVLAMALILIILGSHPAMGAGGIEVEVGDVQGNENEPIMSTGNPPFLQHRSQSPNAKQVGIEDSRLKALDEKLTRAIEEGNRTPAESSGTGSGPPTPSIDPAGIKP
jgi:hypothetical protein